MRLHQNLRRFSVDAAILRNDIPEDTFPCLKVAQRLGQNQHLMLMVHALAKYGFQFVLILNKHANDNILFFIGQIIGQLLTRLLQIFLTGIRKNRSIVHFHIKAVFIIAVLDKDQIVLRHPCLKLKMSTVIVAGRIIINDAVQTILNRMIINLMRAQIVTDRIGITEHINIVEPLKIDRNIRL